MCQNYHKQNLKANEKLGGKYAGYLQKGLSVIKKILLVKIKSTLPLRHQREGKWESGPLLPGKDGSPPEPPYQ